MRRLPEAPNFGHDGENTTPDPFTQTPCDPKSSKTWNTSARYDGLPMTPLFHFTDKDGWKGIGSSKTWRFRAGKPPGPHPRAAYFTTLDENTKYLAARLLVPKSKLAYVFAFSHADDLKPLEGGRGQFVFYSIADYDVEEPRQLRKGATGL
jgi:hypothetical protein